MRQNADDFLAECESLADVLAGLSRADWDKPTLFKNWTANDVMVHLHFWNIAADLSASNEAAFQRLYNAMSAEVKTAGRRAAVLAPAAARSDRKGGEAAGKGRGERPRGKAAGKN